MTVDRSTIAHLADFPMRTVFAPLPHSSITRLIHRPLPLNNVKCIPRVTKLASLCWSQVSLLLRPPLLHLRELEVGKYYVATAEINTSTLSIKLQKLDMTLYSTHRPLRPGDLPDSIRELSINTLAERGAGRFNLPAGVLPASLTFLRLHYLLAAPLVVGSLPPLLTDLHYQDCQPLEPAVLPASLTRLTLTDQYGSALTPATLPQSLRELDMSGYCLNGYMWSLEPGVLPQSLTHLTLRGNGQSIQHGVIPSSLRYFKLEETDYNAPLDGVFPNNSCLEEFVLESAYDFDQSILPLPATVTSLDLRGAFIWNQPAPRWKLHFPCLQRLRLPGDYLSQLGEGAIRQSD